MLCYIDGYHVMYIPLHLVEYVGNYADDDTKMRMGCTCRELRPLIKNGKVRSFIKQKNMLREYQIIRDFVELEYEIEPDEWIGQCLDRNNQDHKISDACIYTLEMLYYRSIPSPKHVEADRALYTIIADEMRLDCPDIVLLFSFYRKVERAGLF